MNGKDHPIQVMINRYCKGKMPKNATKDDWREYNSSFQLLNTTPHGLAVEVYKGYGFCPVYDGRRKKEYFGEAYHIAVDFDSGDEKASISYLSEIPIVRDYASFIYTTPSHTEEKPKARIVWIFDESLMSLSSYELLFNALLWYFPYADQSVRDGLRLYFGSPGCKVWGNWQIFPRKARWDLIDEYRIKQPKKVEVKRENIILPDDVGDEYLNRKLEIILQKLADAPDGKKHPTIWCMAKLLGGYAASGYYTFDTVEKAIRGVVKNNMKSIENYEAAYQTIMDGLEEGRKQPIFIDSAIGAKNGRQ